MEESVNTIANYTNILPTYIDSAELQKELTLYNQLDEFGKRSQQLFERFDNTQMLAGINPCNGALTASRLFEAVPKAGLLKR